MSAVTLCCEACEPHRFMPLSARKCQVCGGPHHFEHAMVTSTSGLEQVLLERRPPAKPPGRPPSAYELNINEARKAFKAGR